LVQFAKLLLLIVIQRRQLFEPVDEKVTNIDSQIGDVSEILAAANFADMRAVLGQLREDQRGVEGQCRRILKRPY
jgi:hypothetical protein